MRAFIAVELSEAVRAEVARLQETLRSAGADVKWVEPENLHLTLKFLGEIDESRVAQVEEALRSAVSPFRSFSFRLEGVGAFPRVNSPKVLWVGVGEGKPKLAELGAAVEKRCAFSPHLTIGRVRSGAGLAQLIQQLEAAEFRASVSTPAEKLVLFQSTLSSHGSIYTPLREILLPGV